MTNTVCPLEGGTKSDDWKTTFTPVQLWSMIAILILKGRMMHICWLPICNDQIAVLITVCNLIEKNNQWKARGERIFFFFKFSSNSNVYEFISVCICVLNKCTKTRIGREKCGWYLC
jgi:hypothetical protein